ncbi:MAG: Lar family restriction alleviation protein [Pyrinomonadaceae bacterium]
MTTKPIDGVSLLPCPFCGVIPTFERVFGGRHDLNGSEFWGVICRSGCEVNVPARRTKESAAKAWNTRAPIDAAQDTIAQQAALIQRMADLSKQLQSLMSGMDGSQPSPNSPDELLQELVDDVRSIRLMHDIKAPSNDLAESTTMLGFSLMFALCHYAFVGARADVKGAQVRFREMKVFMAAREALFREMRTELTDIHSNCSGLPLSEITAEVAHRYPDLELPK